MAALLKYGRPVRDLKMIHRKPYFLAGLVLILLSWLYMLVFFQASCQGMPSGSSLSPPLSYLFTGCISLDGARVALLIFSVLGIALVALGVSGNKAKLPPEEASVGS